MLRIVPTEFMPDNWLNREIQDFLLPLNLAHTAILCRKYNISSNFITPNGVITKFTILIGVICYIGAYYFSLKMYYITSLHVTSSYTAFITYIQYLQIFMILMTLFISLWKHNIDNVDLIKSLQHAMNGVKFGRRHMKYLIINNWIIISSVFLFFIVMSFRGVASVYSVHIVANRFDLLFIDVTLIYAIQMITIMRKVLEVWILNMNCYIYKRGSYHANGEIKDWTFFNKMLVSHHHLMRSYSILQKISAFPIIINFVSKYLSNLVAVQLLINIAKTKHIQFPLEMIVLSFMCMIINFFILCAMSGQFELFYESVNSINTVCLRALNTTSLKGKERKIIKNVYRTNIVHFAKTRPLSLFTVDATLPLSYGSLVTSYAVVLLQFQMGYDHKA